MGSYGVGVSRLVGAIIEAKYDDKNELMKWPLSVSPYDCAIIPMINKKDKSNLEKANNIFSYLKSNNLDAIIDDTEENLSTKIKNFNLIGIPYQIIIGNKTEGENYELTEISVKLNGKKVDARTLIYKTSSSIDTPPSRRYMRILIKAAKSSGLSAEYISSLERRPYVYYPILSEIYAIRVFYWVWSRSRIKT